MAHDGCSFLKGLWFCIVGSIRMILFLGALALLIIASIQAIILFRVSHHGRIDLLPMSPMQMHTYVACTLSLITALLAVHGSFYRHKTSLCLFSTLAAVHALLIVGFIALDNSTDAIKESNDNFGDQLRTAQWSYTWVGDLRTGIYPHSKPTEVWDNLQWGGQCCGIGGPHDWDAKRPAQLPANLFPRSCCKPRDFVLDGGDVSYENVLCKDDETLFQVGCMKRVEQFESLVLVLVVLTFFVQTPLALLAWCVGSHALPEQSDQLPVQVEGAPTVATIYVQRASPVYQSY